MLDLVLLTRQQRAEGKLERLDVAGLGQLDERLGQLVGAERTFLTCRLAVIELIVGGWNRGR